MKRPEKKNYANGIQSLSYVSDLEKYCDQQEQSHKAELKEAFFAGNLNNTKNDAHDDFEKWHKKHHKF